MRMEGHQSRGILDKRRDFLSAPLLALRLLTEPPWVKPYENCYQPCDRVRRMKELGAHGFFIFRRWRKFTYFLKRLPERFQLALSQRLISVKRLFAPEGKLHQQALTL